MAGEFKQGDYHLIIEREGDGWYFTAHTDSERLWGGSLQSLIETLLFAQVCKQQLTNQGTWLGVARRGWTGRGSDGAGRSQSC